MRISHEMGVIQRREYAPASVHLRVVLVDLRDEQEDWNQEQGECQSRDERIRRDIECFKLLQIRDRLKDLLW